MKQLILLLFLITGFTTWSQVPNYVPSDGLVGWWPFNGNANDESGNGNNGTVIGATLTNDRFGNTNTAYAFNDNNNEYIEVMESATINNCVEMSVSFWFIIDANNNYSHFVNKTDIPTGSPEPKQFVVALNDIGFYFYYDAINYFQSTIFPSLNEWHNFTVSYNFSPTIGTGECKFYLDGIEIANFPSTSALNNTNFNMRFGSYADLIINTISGKLDDIGIWNRALTECEIQDLYNAELNAPTVDLGDDQTICSGDDLELDAGAGYNYYNWSTGETTQTITVSAAGTYTATVGDSTAVVNQHSLEFDGDDYIQGSASGSSLDVSGNNTITMNAWIKPNANSNGGTIFSYWPNGLNGSVITNCSYPNVPVHQYMLKLGSNNTIYFLGSACNVNVNQFEQGEANVTVETLSPSEWHYVSMTYDTQTIKLYIDGNLSYTHIVTGTFDQYNLGEYYIGSDNGTDRIEGHLDNINIWNTALSQSEIQNYMNCPPTGNESGLVGYWNFEEGTGNTAIDLTSNGNDGTINGAAYSTDTPEQVCVSCTATSDVVVTEVSASSSTDPHQECDSFTWIDGNTYTESNNNATFVIPNAAGCDSTITLNLTILSPSSSTDTQEACESFTWIDGNTYTDDNTTATFVTTNTAGCDSTITLNLTILSPSNSTDEHEECSSFIWIDGNTYTESNNTATFITTNTAGCDSVITLNLTINNLTTLDAGVDQTVCEGTDVTLTATGAAVYDWDDDVQNGVPFPALLGTNTYTVEGTDANGCEDEQSVTITGTPYPQLIFEVTDPACQGESSGNVVVVASNGTAPYSFVWNNGTLQAENNGITSGTYEVTVTDDIGCEAQGSVVVIDPAEPCFFIPGGLTPNGDGTNETWEIGGLSQYPDAKVMVYDRWGQQVYAGDYSSVPWDGTSNGNDLPTADYYYILDLGNGEKYNGVITLKR
jgi:gliding motility-associated-like protein